MIFWFGSGVSKRDPLKKHSIGVTKCDPLEGLGMCVCVWIYNYTYTHMNRSLKQHGGLNAKWGSVGGQVAGPALTTIHQDWSYRGYSEVIL